MKKFIFVLFLLIVSFNAGTRIFAQSSTTAEPYEEDEFPLWAQDLRRAEIITFGSYPFVTLGVTLGYGAFLFFFDDSVNSFPNPFDKTASSFTTEQTFQILGISLGISGVIALADYFINVSKRSDAEKKRSQMEEENPEPYVERFTAEEAMKMLIVISEYVEE